MRDKQLRDLLEKGGVIYQKGNGYINDGCRDFSVLWDIVRKNEEKLDMLIEHLRLEMGYRYVITNKGSINDEKIK